MALVARSLIRSSRPLVLAPLARITSRAYSQSRGSHSRTARLATAAAFGVAAVGVGFAFAEDKKEAPKPSSAGVAVDFPAVRAAIADILDKDGWDDGSLGPVFVRLAWHASGTYDKNTKTGGSNGATMRFPPESSDGANAGLDNARNFLEPIKKKFPGISYADLWTLAGAVAIEEMGGPKIEWKSGRSDEVADSKKIPPNGRLPDAAQAQDHVRNVFYRMGFNDQEIVALIGAHTLGRCHTNRSGFDGPWTFAPTTFSNEFFRVLVEEKWTERKWNGPKQYQDSTGKLMMLPADLAFIKDPEFKKWVDVYHKDEKIFFDHFAKAFAKLLELGVPRGHDAVAPVIAPPKAAATSPLAPAPAAAAAAPAQKSWWQKIFG